MEDYIIKIKNTEAANIEIIPTEEGVEIVVRRNAKNGSNSGVKSPSRGSYQERHKGAPESKPGTKNGQFKRVVSVEENQRILKDFYNVRIGTHPENPKFRPCLGKFYNFYLERLEKWNNEFKPWPLWLKWVKSEKGLELVYMDEEKEFRESMVAKDLSGNEIEDFEL